MSDGLAPPPDGMAVVIGHDGVLWTLPPRPGARWMAQLSFGLAAGAVAWWAVFQDPAWMLAVPAAALGALFAWQANRRSRIRINDRAITIEHRTFTGVETTRIPLDDLGSAKVSWGEECALVLRTREGQVLLGEGRPETHLQWMEAAIVAAQEAYGRREQAEGRDWKVLRKVPEGLERLRD